MQKSPSWRDHYTVNALLHNRENFPILVNYRFKGLHFSEASKVT